MNGFGRHADFIISGKGQNPPLMFKDYQLMRWTSANAYRTSHYPLSQEEMQVADRKGFLIIDEIPTVRMQFENEENTVACLKMALRQLDELISHVKNYPSVGMWSVAIEPMPASFRLDSESDEVKNDPMIRRGHQFLDTLFDLRKL